MRAGTTWLSKLLRSYPDCAMTPFKEIHFFDIRYGKYAGFRHYRAAADRLQSLSRTVSKRVNDALDESIGEMPKRDPDGALDAADPELRNDDVAWTDKIRNDFFS